MTPAITPSSSLSINTIEISGYEKVVEAFDASSGLHAIVAVHNTKLGPALGGTRMRPYPCREDALNDVLRLSKGMSYKSAIPGIGLGGGKSVINADPKTEKTEKLLRSFAELLESLNGLYICAEDMGTTPDDMAFLAQYTKYVSATPAPGKSGDPSPFTAWGVFRSMQATAKQLWDTTSLAGKTIAIQGLGSVGEKLMDALFWHQAKLIVSDIDTEKAKQLAYKYGATAVESEAIYDAPCDIFAPCAIGGIINDHTLPRLKCEAVVGGANNQLLCPEHGQALLDKNILYAPDYIVNAGGIMNISIEIHGDGYDPSRACALVNTIYDNLLEVYAISKKRSIPTSTAAEELALQKLA